MEGILSARVIFECWMLGWPGFRFQLSKSQQVGALIKEMVPVCAEAGCLVLGEMGFTPQKSKALVVVWSSEIREG